MRLNYYNNNTAMLNVIYSLCNVKTEKIWKLSAVKLKNKLTAE